jgi:4'-phosphopantetheinyl transferase
MTSLAGEMGSPFQSVDIWRVSAEASPLVIVALGQVLHPDETAHAARFYFERDRRQFIVARSVLRHLLGSRLGIPPREVPIRYKAHGKPWVDGPFAFNVAHSAGLIVVALTSGGDIGVDVERIDPSIDAMQIAEDFYSRSETERLRRLRGAERIRGFFRCWARKEAYLKAIGSGLSRPLGDFDVAVDRTQRSALLRVGWDWKEVGRWRLLDLSLHPHYACALAIERGPFRLCVRRHRLVPALELLQYDLGTQLAQRDADEPHRRSSLLMLRGAITADNRDRDRAVARTERNCDEARFAVNESFAPT